MIKEDFKKKYHGQVVAITYPMGLGSFNGEREVAEKTNQLKNICREMGLKVTELPDMAHVGLPKKTFAIIDPDKPQTGYSGQPSVAISIEEFLEDFGHYIHTEEESQFVKARKLLAEFKIEYGVIEKKSKHFTSTDVVDEGFIQGYTSNEASLWWHPNGRRVFFVRGEGAFELGEKGEENA